MGAGIATLLIVAEVNTIGRTGKPFNAVAAAEEEKLLEQFDKQLNHFKHDNLCYNKHPGGCDCPCCLFGAA